ncbi:MAG: TAXI family TRAP transporter solute-binding subunit [bacterium]
MRKSIAASVIVLLCLGVAQAQDKKISLMVATGGLGGVYYYYGTTVAEIISKTTGYEATAIQTAASVDNIMLIQKRTDPKANIYYLGLILPDSAILAFKGEHEKFKASPAKDLRILWAMYSNYIHIVTKADSGIKKLSDLKGKRVSTGAPGSGTEVEAFMILEAGGVKVADLAKQERLGAAESAEALASGTIDAYFWSGGLPTASITELATTLSRKGAKLAMVTLKPDEDVVKNIHAKYPGVCEPGVIPKSVYNTDEDTPTLVFWNLFMCSEALPEAAAYNITKAVFTNLSQLHNAVKPSKETTLENAVKFLTGAIPYHPGAVKYFKEAGAIK